MQTIRYKNKRVKFTAKASETLVFWIQALRVIYNAFCKCRTNLDILRDRGLKYYLKCTICKRVSTEFLSVSSLLMTNSVGNVRNTKF